IRKYPKIALGCSFGKDSMVLLHLTLSTLPNIPVFALLSDTEFPETYTFIQWTTKNSAVYGRDVSRPGAILQEPVGSQYIGE
ncbi:MAG: phosphoadenosine phosphosulfate reductase family protein, partial [Rhabdochlamydiaceae bacterium]